MPSRFALSVAKESSSESREEHRGMRELQTQRLATAMACFKMNKRERGAGVRKQ